MCFPKIGEDLDEEDEVSDREALLRSADRIDDASDEEEAMKKTRAGRFGGSKTLEFNK